MDMALIRKISNVRLFTTSAACLCLDTKKARIPHDRRYAPNAKDVNERRPGGNKKFRIKYGLRGQGEGGTYITGYVDKHDKLHKVPEMVPELIAPDLTDFKLKPYVSYAVPDTIQPEFTAKHLFDATIGKQLKSDYQSGKISLEDVKKNLEDIKLISDNETIEEQDSETLQHVNKT